MECGGWWRAGSLQSTPHGAAPSQLREEKSATRHVYRARQIGASGRGKKVGASVSLDFVLRHNNAQRS